MVRSRAPADPDPVPGARTQETEGGFRRGDGDAQGHAKEGEEADQEGGEGDRQG